MCRYFDVYRGHGNADRCENDGIVLSIGSPGKDTSGMLLFY